jgi:diguanylate cyclase (GGDEF)-like protein
MDNEKNFKKRRFKIENFSIIFVDLDNLKKVNDLYGHKFGDKFIKMSAYILKGCLRDLDIVARWGGDEFVIGLINIADEEAHDIAEKLNRKISLIEIPNVNVRFSASFGVISAKNKYQQRILNLYELIEKADLAMYEIKQKKKRGIVAHYIEKFMSRKHKLDHGTHVTIKKINLDGIVHQNNHPPK